MDKIVEIKHERHVVSDSCGLCGECPMFEGYGHGCKLGLSSFDDDTEEYSPSGKCPGPGKYRMSLEAIPEGAIQFINHNTVDNPQHKLHGSMWIEKDDPPTPDNPCKFLLFHDDDGECVTFVANAGYTYKMPSGEFYEKFERVASVDAESSPLEETIREIKDFKLHSVSLGKDGITVAGVAGPNVIEINCQDCPDKDKVIAHMWEILSRYQGTPLDPVADDTLDNSPRKSWRGKNDCIHDMLILWRDYKPRLKAYMP